MLGPAHIVGVSKTAYVLATPRCLHWRRDLQRNQHERRSTGPGSAGSVSPACSSSSRRSPRPSATRSPAILVLDPRRPHHPSTAPAARTPVRSARPTVPSPTARRSSTRSRASPTSIRICSVPCARPRPMPRTTASSPRRQRLAFPGAPGAAPPRGDLKYGSEAEAARWVATPDTSAHVSGDAVDIGPSEPRRGCPSTAPRTGSAGSTATSRGTTNCARTPATRLPRHVRRPDARPKDAAVRRVRPRLTALALIALIAAGCGRTHRPRPSTGSATATRHAQRARRCGSPSACGRTGSASSRTRTRRAS